jgi:hypothetical protein
VPRGRHGRYTATDFLLVLLSFLVSRAPSLLAWTPDASTQALLMATGARLAFPSRSALSRWLQAVDAPSLARWRALSRSLLEQSPWRPPAALGVWGANGCLYALWDADGTRSTHRQRALPTGPHRPPPRRRSQGKPGYTGRKRGEHVFTRWTLQHSHTGEFLGAWSAPGSPGVSHVLPQMCHEIRHLHTVRADPARPLLRLDGEAGKPVFLQLLQAESMDYLVRFADYSVLTHPCVVQALCGPSVWMRHEESGVLREVFDIRAMPLAEGPSVHRLLVTRIPLALAPQPLRVGKIHQGYVYEVFATTCPPEAFGALSLLSFYWGRAQHENALAQEDQELCLDHRVSFHPEGQALVDLLAQWVWNWRIWAGSQLRSPASCVRETDWRVEGLQPDPPPACSQEPLVTPIHEASQTDPSDSPALSLQRTAQGARCPAGHRLRPRGQIQRKDGRYQRYQVTARRCEGCPTYGACWGSRPREQKNRWWYARLEEASETSDAAECEGTPQEQPVDKPNPGAEGVQAGPPPTAWREQAEQCRWVDLPAAGLRRQLWKQTWNQRVEGGRIPAETPLRPRQPLTRDQRAHRRLTYALRHQRNHRSLPCPCVLHHIPKELASFCGLFSSA